MSMVTVICYGKAEIWMNRRRAADHYYRACIECDGHEAERYGRVLAGLLDGNDYAWDGCEIPEGYEQVLGGRE